MKTFRLFACLALFAPALAAAGCSKDDKHGDDDSAKEETAQTATGAADEGDEAKPAPGEPKTDAVARPEVPDREEERAKKGAEHKEPAARLAGPGEDRDLVAIGATKTKIVQLSNKTVSETDEYVLRLELPDKVKKGAEGKVKVKLSPKKGWKLNKDFPTKLEVQPPSGVEVAKKSQGVDDAVTFSEKKGAVWEVGFKSSSAGNKEFGGKFKFAVCTETTCDPKREKLAFAVEVK